MELTYISQQDVTHLHLIMGYINNLLYYQELLSLITMEIKDEWLRHRGKHMV